MGEYADDFNDAGIDDWRGSEGIPASAWAPQSKDYKMAEIDKSRETAKAYCIRLMIKGEPTPFVFVPKSKCKIVDDFHIRMPIWLSQKKAQEAINARKVS